MTIALIITIGALFLIQTIICQYNNTQDSREKLTLVREKLADNDKQIANLTESLSENNLAKARAFADMLALDSSILEEDARLTEIQKRLMVNELHVIDEKGIITHSTIPTYVGFDMASGEQSKAFMVIIEDSSIELVQEPQENVAEHVVMQYIGVARKDAPGLVQIGIQPEILEKMLASTKLDVVLNEIDFGKNGYIFAIDLETQTVSAHPNSKWIGMSAKEAGLDITRAGTGAIQIDGVKGFYVTEEYDGLLIGTFLPSGEYFETRYSQILATSLSLFLIFGVLLLMINRMVQQKIVLGIDRITASMKAIADGDYHIVVEERGNLEFEQLSDNMNKMVQNIRNSIDENKELLKKQQEAVEGDRTLIENIKNVCENLNEASGETLTYADDIQNGAKEQERTVAELKQVMSELTGALNTSATAATQVTSKTQNAAKKILQTQEQMECLKHSMDRINTMSAKIEKIIDDITSIAQQTNMLSLNASIEAARAGELGKGFAVVATQVGELASRSSQAAKETGELIMSSIQAVESGKEITEKTAAAFATVVEDIESASNGIGEISEMVQENVHTVSLAADEIGRISEVVEKNVTISHNSKQVSSNMAHITKQLMNLVET